MRWHIRVSRCVLKIERMKNTPLSSLILVALLTAAGLIGISVAAAEPTAEPRGYAAQRERLVTGLQLDLEQQKKLDAITSAMLPRVWALQGMGKAEREPARAQLKLEAQQKLHALLTPEQRATYAVMQAKQAASGTSHVPAAAKEAASGAAGS